MRFKACDLRRFLYSLSSPVANCEIPELTLRRSISLIVLMLFRERVISDISLGNLNKSVGANTVGGKGSGFIYECICSTGVNACIKFKTREDEKSRNAARNSARYRAHC